MRARVQRLLAWVQTSPAGRFLARWNEDNGSTLAVSIAYFGLFSLFPLLLALTAVVGYVVRDPATLASVERLATSALPSQVVPEVRQALLAARENAGSLTVLGLLGLLWSGSGLFGAIAQAFDNVYRVPPRGFVANKLVAVAMTLVFIALLPLSVAASSLSALALSATAETLPFASPGWEFAQVWAGRAVSFLSLLLLFLAIYLAMPNTRVRLAETLPGALLATALFGLATQLLPLYVRYFGQTYRSYSIFGVLLLLTFWFYILGNILVLGAELNAFLHRRRVRQGDACGPPHPARLRPSREARASEEPAPARVAPGEGSGQQPAPGRAAQSQSG